MAKILILDDDPEICDAIKTKLQENLHTVDDVQTGDDAIEFLARYDYDLALLDVQVPGLTGLDVLQYARTHCPTTKVILLTCLSSIEDRLKGFAQGADDYLPKPFDMRELLARISAVVKRANIAAEDCIIFGDVVLDRKLLEVRKRGVPIKVQPKDFALLEFFMRYPQETFSTDNLLDRVWSADSNASVEGLRMAVSRLRKAIDDPNSDSSVIVSVNRVGYRLGLI